MMRIAVFGASGFVGAMLVERLWQASDVEIVPVIHSSGSAARLARFARPLVMADALQPDTVARALNGCTHVVNCSRGPSEVMLRGLENLLEASRRARVQRFVHLSSVAAYGDVDVPILEEAATPKPTPYTYGWTKHKQDLLVERASARGLSCTVLCPPNISGCYSPFLVDLVQTIGRGELALIGAGEAPCELVDVANLVHSIRLALAAPDTGPQRIFVTDGGTFTWGSLASALAPLADWDAALPTVSAEFAARSWGGDGAAAQSFSGAVKHLFSSEVRGALKEDPWIAATEKSLRSSLRKLPALERALRQRFAGRPTAPRPASTSRYSARLMRQQLRNVRYSQTRARELLNYEPVVGAEQSIAAFRAWYRDVCGWGDAAWPLTRQLLQAGGR
jgi:nucleoside-diphosphate-sugar epimerase